MSVISAYMNRLCVQEMGVTEGSPCNSEKARIFSLEKGPFNRIYTYNSSLTLKYSGKLDKRG